MNNIFYLKLAEKLICEFSISKDKKTISTITPFVEKEHLLFLTSPEKFNNWITNRVWFKQQREFKDKTTKENFKNLEFLFSVNHLTTIADDFWISNNPSETFQKEKWLSETKYSFFKSDSNNNGANLISGGFEKKRWVFKNNTWFLQKGFEEASTANEIFAFKFSELLKDKKIINNPYQLCLTGNKQIFNENQNFKPNNQSFLPINTYLDVEKPQNGENWLQNESNVELLIKLIPNAKVFLKDLIVFDGIIWNIDRHTNNIGFFIDNNTLDIIGFSPIFDNGCSFLSSAKKFYTECFLDDEYLSEINIQKIETKFGKNCEIFTNLKKLGLLEEADFLKYEKWIKTFIDFWDEGNLIKQNKVLIKIFKNDYDKTKHLLFKNIKIIKKDLEQNKKSLKKTNN